MKPGLLSNLFTQLRIMKNENTLVAPVVIGMRSTGYCGIDSLSNHLDNITSVSFDWNYS
jgi:hypothetical protein